MDGENAQVDVAVEVETPDAGDSPGVVVVTDGGGEASTDGDVVVLLAGLTGAVATLTERVGQLESATQEAQITAEVAEMTAEAAAGEAERLATETEEAVAAVAEEAGAATAEVAAEVDDIAPNREHGWFKSRSVLREKDGQ